MALIDGSLEAGWAGLKSKWAWPEDWPMAGSEGGSPLDAKSSPEVTWNSAIIDN